jgi:basic membrane protein A
MLSGLVAAGLMLAACAPAATPAPTEVPAEPTAAPTEAPAEEPTEAPAEEPTEAPAAEGGRVCEVTDVGGVDDRSFNQTAWEGAQTAAESVGWEALVLESQDQSDYETNINEFVQQGCDLIVTVGFLLGDATSVAGLANPEQKFLILDFAYGPSDGGLTQEQVDSLNTNVAQQVYATEEGAFLAGYVAASFTKTGVVGTFGGINIPPVSDFMVGFQQGIEYYNEQKGTEVQLIGWSNEAKDGTFVNNFESQEDGRNTAIALMDEGADIILPVAGPVGLGSAAAVRERGDAYIIGVDTDWFLSTEYGDVVLTSVLKRLDQSVIAATTAAYEDAFSAGVTLGNLANGQVGIAPFHDYENQVSPDLAAELEAIQAAIIAGDIDVVNFSELP